MGSALIREFLTGDSKEIRDLAKNEAVLVGFLTLVKGVDDLPEVSSRFYEKPRSLYQVTASGYSMEELIRIMAEFFGPPAKVPGKELPVSLRFEPTVKSIGGIRKDQALFLKKIKTGAFYGALWPWQRDAGKIEILLGYRAIRMGEADYHQLERLIQKFLNQKKIEAASGVGGQIHGISLPSFLQMSEMEGATYTLKVSSAHRTGHLYIDGGNLIAAQFGELTGNAAAYRIISWDNAAIQIQAADAGRDREIHDPLMHVMMESLKIKDEEGSQSPPTVSDTAPSAPPPPPNPDQPEPPVDVPAAMDVPTSPETTEETAPTLPPETLPEPRPAAPLDAPSTDQPNAPLIDRSMGKQQQMRRASKLLIVLALVIVFAIGMTGGGKWMEKRKAERRYLRLEEKLARTKALDEQIVSMLQYIRAHPQDAHRAELETRLAGAYVEIEKRDYEKTLVDVSRLPIDEMFENKALSLYTAFMTKYPDSAYKPQIDESIEGIGQLLGTAYFQSLKKIAATDFLSRYAAYQSYLEQFPEGEKRQVVERMIEDLSREYLGTIEKKIQSCDVRKNWQPCIEQCDRFLSAFSDGGLVERVEALRGHLQDQEELAQLTQDAILAGDDYSKAKRIYTDYLARRPDTTQKETILQRIDRLNAELAEKRRWEEMAAYATDSGTDIFHRVQRLDAYRKEHKDGPYALPAATLRKRLEPERKAAIRAQQQAAARRRSLAEEQAERDRRDREVRRLSALQAKVAGRLAPLSDRFVDNGNGMVTDLHTGLTWCILDSYLALGQCISYDEAVSYVRSLTTGGHSDWTLPTAGELASLYKNRPFFPGSGAQWYWTSESFVRGFHRVVDVVTSVPENVFTRTSKGVESCGAVRAVRR